MHRYTISTPTLRVELLSFGARITSILFLNNGEWKQVHEYYESDGPYMDERRFSGTTIGPFANRISNASFSIKNTRYNLEQNEGKHSLHSGDSGFHLQDWAATQDNESTVRFTLDRNEKEDGFPGDRKFQVLYRVECDSLFIEYSGRSSEDTIMNITNHAYFSLDQNEDLSRHRFKIYADSLVEVDKANIPTGNLIPVANSIFDLNEWTQLADVYDHCYVLKDEHAASVYSNDSNIRMDVYTNQPGVQFYTGDGRYFCLETQHFPDTPNNPSFPSCTLSKGDEYTYHCICVFSNTPT